MTAAFAVVLVAYMRGRRDARLKQETLRETAKSDGRHIAAHIDEFMQPEVVSPGVVPADQEVLAGLLSEITQELGKRKAHSHTPPRPQAAPLARVDGLEPTNAQNQQRVGRPSFWERPSRALPDRKGTRWWPQQ